jgi:hypothetical protein
LFSRYVKLAAPLAAFFLSLAQPLTAAHVEARVLNLPVVSAQARAAAEGKLAPNVRIFYGAQAYPVDAVVLSPARLERSFITRADDLQRCELLFGYLMSVFTRYARDIGGDALVNVRSVVDGQEVSSTSTFACDVQFRKIKVELIATVVKLP